MRPMTASAATMSPTDAVCDNMPARWAATWVSIFMASRTATASPAAELRLVFLEIDDPRALHEPFVRRNRIVLDALLSTGPAAAADALEDYLIQSERLVLGAFARMGRS